MTPGEPSPNPVPGRPLTVLHLAANRWWTGSADPVIRLAAALKARGHRVLLGVSPGDRFEAKARLAGLDLVEGLRLSARAAPIEIARDVRRLRALARDASIDVIHTHHSHDHWLSLLARPRATSGRRPAIARTFHNLRSVRRGAVARGLYARTAVVFAVSRQIADRCRDVGVPPERVVQIPGIADLPRFASPADARAIRDEFELGDAPVIVTVSRLAANRGHELLLAGFRRLLDTIPGARLLMVGKGETRRHLETVVSDLGLARHVVFTGYRDRDLPEVLAAADCFALMAAGSDDSCRAALEAMAASRPVVARRVGALPETVAHGETGLLIGEDSAESVAAALGAILGDRARARAMGAAARARAEREFSVERCVGIVEREYRRVAGA